MKKLRKFRKNENPKSTEFTNKLNAIIQDVERANNIKISVEGNAKGSTISNKRGHNFIIRVPRSREGVAAVGVSEENPSALPDSSDVGVVRRARTTQDAPGNDTIRCSLYDEVTGVLAIEGPEYNTDVICLISNGSALNSATRRLEENDELFVTVSVFDNGGTPDFRWYAIEGFAGTEDCVCKEPV